MAVEKPNSVPLSLEGFALCLNKDIKKNSGEQDGFLRFKIQISESAIKSVICFNLKLLPEIDVALNDGLARAFKGLRRPKSLNTFIKGQPATIT